MKWGKAVNENPRIKSKTTHCKMHIAVARAEDIIKVAIDDLELKSIIQQNSEIFC